MFNSWNLDWNFKIPDDCCFVKKLHETQVSQSIYIYIYVCV